MYIFGKAEGNFRYSQYCFKIQDKFNLIQDSFREAVADEAWQNDIFFINFITKIRLNKNNCA